MICSHLMCHGAVRRDEVEPLFECTLEKAISESRKASDFVEDLTSKGYAELDADALVIHDDQISAGLMYLWK